jgi:beta-galactosidase
VHRMKNRFRFQLLFIPAILLAEGRTTFPLNGIWQFDQTQDAFPPRQFTRTCPVPGLIHLARPKVEDFDAFFTKPQKAEFRAEHDLTQRRYEPRYSWYRRAVFVPDSLRGREAVLTLLKSQFVTQVFVNGMDAGGSMSCFTPIDVRVTPFLRFGAENEILVRVGERIHLPSEAAGGTDKEKVTYLPGIWDDVFLSFSGNLRIQRILLLPDNAGKKLTAKVLVRSFYPSQIFYGSKMRDSCRVSVRVRSKSAGAVTAFSAAEASVKRDALTAVALEIPMADAHAWTPDDPFLYNAEVSVFDQNRISDRETAAFGMRDFSIRGRSFELNGERFVLRGTNITLHRFFEDPECEALPWDKAWVLRLLSDIPKKLHWNAMRICVGIAPKFWYDIADSSGLLLQNEWMYWQNHGWDEQIRREYTDWLWADGSHPSIAIWDAINENWDPFIGNALIPELKKLDPTRPWDAGYMTAEHMAIDEMDEPHPYMAPGWRPDLKEHLDANPHPLGDLHFWPKTLSGMFTNRSAQLVNEYGWVWLWRNGSPSFLTVPNYSYYIGDYSNPDVNREFQAYWLQLETEWLRTERSLAGVLAFCYLTNNYGFTGDWFLDPIRDLRPGPTLDWFAHAFSPVAAFIDLVDGRYTRHVPPYSPGSELSFNLVGVNDNARPEKGNVTLRICDAAGKTVLSRTDAIVIPEYGKTYLPVFVRLPKKTGGYLIAAEYRPFSGPRADPVISRRFIKVGDAAAYPFYEMKPPGIR